MTMWLCALDFLLGGKASGVNGCMTKREAGPIELIAIEEGGTCGG
jgi:hypothetical protein